MLPTVSFEFFPPRSDGAQRALLAEIEKLAALDPVFMTVTYGAGGSTRDWTARTAVEIQARTGVPTAAHLTCVNTEKGGIGGIANALWTDGIRHIVALRGDIPAEDSPLEYDNSAYYHYANELVAGLKALHDFEISVAAYPEKHPDAPDMATDIAHLKRKCEAGADRAITQFFFDNAVYEHFVEKTAQAGIRVPVVPGLLPIMNFEKMLGFAKTCAASVPDWLHAKFTRYRDDSAAMDAMAQDILTAQLAGLIAQGVPHVHFYTLNRADMVMAACAACGLGVKSSGKKVTA